MKRTIYTIVAASMFMVLSGCGGAEADANDHADELCDCLVEAGLDKSLSLSRIQDRRYMRDMERKMETTVPTCALKVMREMEEDLSDLSKNEKKDYTKSFLKGCIDTDCADIALDLIPYDMMGFGLNEVERQVERQRGYRERRDEYRDDYRDWEEEAQVEREMEELEELFR